MKPSNRKGNLWLIGIMVVAVLALIIGAFALFGGDQGLSIAEQACTDFQPAGGTCSTASDCVASLVPPGETLSENVELRCNVGSCELRVLQCGVIEQ